MTAILPSWTAPEMPGIGLLNEKPLHASLKKWYALPGDRFEVPVDGFVVDIVRGDLLLEIQTANVSAMKSKLTQLLGSHPIRLIYPIAREKWIVRLPQGIPRGPNRRKSPKRGRLEDLFREMVSIPELLSDGHLSLEVLMIREEETRRYDGKRNWRRKGWVTEQRRLIDVVDRRMFETSTDWLAFVPEGMESFTTRDLSEASGIGMDLAQKMAYVLRKMNLIEQIGKRGRAHLYRIPGTAAF